VYLKSLELVGFKSFPDRTKINFSDGITTIVGPNGSGKSNISDAVRWVFGEQSSKSLRGEKMEDVIFAGSQKRSAVGFAEVTLTLDNSAHFMKCDYEEVAITRRYYRSGDSEYFINKTQVRLKDVRELLMDTGLGKDGYSIIGQGKVGDIVAAKSEDRREVFEEAAGISKFRHRKDESEKKLEQTEESLVRIRDIVGELEGRIGPLKKQSEDAKRYLILRDEQRQLDVDLWLTNLDKARENLQKAESDYAVAASQFDRETAAADALFAELEEISAKMRDFDVEIEGLRVKQSDNDREIAERSGDAAVIRNSIENNLESIKNLEDEIRRQNEQAVDIDNSISSAQAEIAALNVKGDELRAELAEFTDKNKASMDESNEAEGKIEALRLEQNADIALAAQLKIESASYESAAQAASDRNEEIDREIEAKKPSRDEAEASLKSAKKVEQDAEERAQSARNIIGGFELKAGKRREKLVEKRENYQKLVMAKNAAQNRIELLEELERDMEGYSKAVKTVLSDSTTGRLRGVHGTVAQLLNVPPKYAVAVEIALGAALQNIIVDRPEDAKAAMYRLRQNDGGRATFLPIAAIRGRELNERGLMEEEGVLGAADRLVSFDNRYAEIMSSLLGRTVITEDMDISITLAKKYGYRFRIVTLDGQVINSGGSMTGGSVSKSAGIISRTNELASKREELAKLTDRMKTEAAELEALEHENAAVEHQMDAARENLREGEDAVLAARAEISRFEAVLEGVDAAVFSLEDEKQRNIQKQSDAKREIADRAGRIIELENSAAEIGDRIAVITGGQKELAEARETIANQISEIMTRISDVTAEIRSKESVISTLRDMAQSMEGNAASRADMIENIRAKNIQLEAEETTVNDRVATLTVARDAIKNDISGISDRRMKLEAERETKQREHHGKSQTLTALAEERSRLEVRRNSSASDEEQIIARLWDTYELNLTAATAMRREIESVAAVTRRIAEIKGEIRKLEPVNVGAIEEYKEVGERFEFMSAQKDDLEKAKEELVGIITDITEEMKTIFADSFETINRHFGETFAEIFGGGTAQLELTEPDDVLASGIEIKVQPPGKSLKTISLLSGGENAFVAIALYFALMKVRPTPFCILDEIESALDDINVSRFANYLHKLSDKTQFIAISHRRGTMESANMLYGVTMQEGVSRVLAMSISELENKFGKDLK